MQIHIARTTLSRALSVVLLGIASGPAFAQAQEQPPAQASAQEPAPAQPQAAASESPDVTQLDAISVTGYRRSLQFSTDAKRESTGFTDSIFAEDIGKFPDQNIAESLSRVPGIQLGRDVNGEGVNVAIRGLGTSFTKTTLNGSSVATASIGLNAQNQNREVDLNLLPTEFFTQLTVHKTPMAGLLEGGVSGVVDMRSARPFDNPGTHFTYQLQAEYNDISEKTSPRGSFMGSWTNEAGTFGALVGLSSVRGKIGVEGFETIGWTNPGLNEVQCGITPPPAPNEDQAPYNNRPASCNTGGGGNWLIPSRVPDNASTRAAGLAPNDPITRDMLLALNPGLTIEQIGEALVPRLGRPVHMSGDRDRDSVVASFEWKPNEDMSFYLDTMYSKARRTNERIAINLVMRNFAANGAIPIDMQLDGNGVVTSATFANAQFFLEARPYIEEVQFWNVNPGAQIFFGENDNIKLDVQANLGRSWMFRESPTVLVNTPFTTIQYLNQGGDFPTWQTDLNLNDPNLGWTWEGGRVNIQNEKRVTETQGARADLQFGEDKNNVTVGFAYDEAERRIQGFDNSAAWENVACRGLNPDGSVPNPRPPCAGGPLAAVPNASLASYLRPGPHGFVTVDFDRFKRDTNYYELRDNAPESGAANTAASTGGVHEKNMGFYVELNGEADILDRPLRFNAGVRYVTTDQETRGPVQTGTSRNYVTLKSDYKEVLPSFSAAWDVADDVVLRMSGSRTMTRPNPSSMLPNTNFSDPVAQQATRGNPDLTPYLSTNFDIGGEWYTGDEGFIGLTLFDKRIDGFTVLGTQTIPFRELGIAFEDLNDGQRGAINSRGGPDAATVTVQQQVNADGTLNIRGWEAIWVQPLDKWVNGLGFMANYTKIKQSAEGDAPAVAVGVAPDLWNATAYWENDVASVRLSYTWTDDMIASQTNENGIPYARRTIDARGQLDLSASYTFTSLPTEPQITLNVTNITGEKMRQAFHWDNATYEYYDPGTTVMLGVRGKF